MFRILVYLIIIGLFSCNSPTDKDKDKYVRELPDAAAINESILAVILVDSLNYNFGISKSIKEMKIYYPVKWNNDSVPPPPPPPAPALSFYKIFSFMDYSIDASKRKNDSIFVSLQADTTRKFELDKQIYSKFNNASDEYYQFYIPIFSFDKNYVFIQYWRNCGALCGECESIVLKKLQNKWTKIDKWSCGMR